MSKFNIPWPSDKDKLFKEGSAWDPKVAVLDDWIKFQACDVLLPEYYKKAADIIICYVVDDKHVKKIGPPHMYLFPIVYLYRHSTELYLKNLIQHGIQLQILDESKRLQKLMGEHKLYPLWRKACVVLEEVFPNFNKNDLRNVGRLVKEFDEADPTGQNWRYAKDKTGKHITEKLPLSVDLVAIRDTFDGLFRFFEGWDAMLWEARDWKYNY